MNPTLVLLNQKEIVVGITEDKFVHATVQFVGETMMFVVPGTMKGEKEIIVCIQLEANGITLTHGYGNDPKPTLVEIAH